MYLKVSDMPLFFFLAPKPQCFKYLLNLLLKEKTEGFARKISPVRWFCTEVQRPMKALPQVLSSWRLLLQKVGPGSVDGRTYYYKLILRNRAYVMLIG